MRVNIMRGHIFKYYHPAVIFLYFLSVIGFTMATMNPIFVALSFIFGSVYYISLRGSISFFKHFAGYTILLFVITAANTLFNGLGLTVIMTFGERFITLEALVFGVCSAGVLISVLQWFACYNEVMTSDKFLNLFGRILPTVSMMIALIFRYIPETVRKSRQINCAQVALSQGGSENKKHKFMRGIRMMSILMSWSLENSIETADSMNARGYSSGKKRTKCSNEKLALRDVISIVILLILTAVNLYCMISKVNHFDFYPFIELPKIEIWVILVYVILLIYPLILEVRSRIKCLIYRL